MNRWIFAAIFLLLFYGAWNLLFAQDSSLSPLLDSVATSHTDSFITLDSTHADSSLQIVGAFTSFGYWIYDNLRAAWLYVADKLKPVTRTLARIWYNLLHSPDDNSIIRVPLSKRK